MIVLDKTGTVTTGKMSLVDVAAASGADPAEVLRLAGTVEDDGLARQRLLDPAGVPDDLFGFALKWLFTGIGAAAGAAAPPAQPGRKGESH